MANLTLAIDDELLREARIKALKRAPASMRSAARRSSSLVDRKSAGERQAASCANQFANALPRPSQAPALRGRGGKPLCRAVRSIWRGAAEVNAFVDTNVVVYAHDRRDVRKQARAIRLLEQHAREGTLTISTQVLAGEL